MDDSQAVNRGRRVLAEFEELKGVFERLEAGLFRELKQTPIGQDAKVQRLHMTLHSLAGIQSAMREMIDAGRIADHAIAVAGLNRPN